jgi:hypothetical protein
LQSFASDNLTTGSLSEVSFIKSASSLIGFIYPGKEAIGRALRTLLMRSDSAMDIEVLRELYPKRSSMDNSRNFWDKEI